MKRPPVDWRVAVAAIAGVTVIEVVALYQGVDGRVLAACVGVIGAIAGAVGVNLTRK